MRRHQGNAAAGRMGREARREPRLAVRIERSRRFVEEPQPARCQKKAGQREPPALAGRAERDGAFRDRCQPKRGHGGRGDHAPQKRGPEGKGFGNRKRRAQRVEMTGIGHLLGSHV